MLALLPLSSSAVSRNKQQFTIQVRTALGMAVVTLAAARLGLRPGTAGILGAITLLLVGETCLTYLRLTDA